MRDDELELVKATAEGTAAGPTKSLHELILKPVGPIAGEIGESWGGWAKVWRLKRALRLRAKIEEMLLAHGLPPRPVPLKLLVPAIDAASVEDDDYLQDMWAALLANAATGNADVGRSGTFVEVLRQLSSHDGRFLAALSEDHGQQGLVVASDGRNIIQDCWLESRLHGIYDTSVGGSDFELAVENLMRVGILAVDQARFSTGARSNPHSAFHFTERATKSLLKRAARAADRPSPRRRWATAGCPIGRPAFQPPEQLQDRGYVPTRAPLLAGSRFQNC